MSEKKKRKHDPTYAALAAGPGSFEKAVRAALRRTPPSDPAKPEPPTSRERPVVKTDPVSDRPNTPSWQTGESDAGPPQDVSPAYRRVIEELSTYLVPGVAHRVLKRCLEEEGASPEEAIPYDLRAILVDALPRRLRQVLSRDRAAAAIEAIEQALTQVHTPPSVPRRDPSSGTVPSTNPPR